VSVGPLHRDVREVLSTWASADDEQAAMRDDYVAFLDQNDDAVWRSCVPGHITASTLVVSADRTEVLLTLHAKIGRWLQMGGHCEPGDLTLRDAALREATEESGIEGLQLDASPVRLDRHWVGCHGGAWHLDVQYVAIAPASAVAVISEESLDLAWFDLDALPDDSDDALRELTRTARG
jgi:8-oxo-dGTP pyrophosphatase MutT (NUDIX family)